MTKLKDEIKPPAETDVSANTPPPAPTHLTIVFAQDYRGHLTAEQYFTKGERVEFPVGQARALVDASRAKFAVDVK